MPQKNVNNRAMYWPRGRVWGGSSSLNAMVYVRGHAEDYNRWEREGAAGWGYEAVLPYFKKAQVRSPRVKTPAPDLRLVQTHSCGGNEYRGDSGPLHVTRYEARGQLDQAWLEAGQQAGVAHAAGVVRGDVSRARAQATRSARTSTGSSRRAWARWTPRCTAACGGAPPRPTSGPRCPGRWVS